MRKLNKLFFLVVWLLLIVNESYSYQFFFTPNYENFLRVRGNIIAPIFKRNLRSCNGGEVAQIINTINDYIPADRWPKNSETPLVSNCYGHEDYGKNYYVSITKGKTIAIIDLNSLNKRTISRKRLTGTFAMACLSPDEKFLSIACEVTVPHKHFLGGIGHSLGLYYGRELVIKTVSLEDDHFYHEKRIDQINKYHGMISLCYINPAGLCSTHTLCCSYTIKEPFDEKCAAMFYYVITLPFCLATKRDLRDSEVYKIRFPPRLIVMHGSILSLEELHSQ